MSECPPELEVLLQGIESQEGREAVIHAYHRMSGGDPDSIPVQFALVVKSQALLQKRCLSEFNELVSKLNPERSIDLEAAFEKLETNLKQTMPTQAALIDAVKEASPTHRDLNTLSDSLKGAITNFPKGGGNAGSGLLVAVFILLLVNTGLLAWLLVR